MRWLATKTTVRTAEIEAATEKEAFEIAENLKSDKWEEVDETVEVEQ
jgi:hypothetical protein